jgi:hypothetical protein
VCSCVLDFGVYGNRELGLFPREFIFYFCLFDYLSEKYWFEERIVRGPGTLQYLNGPEVLARGIGIPLFP